MDRTRRVTAAFIAAIALLIGASTLAAIPTASADPPGICGGPGLPPCAGPNPLTPEQQCALIAWRAGMPCNWLGMQVPQGTPGSWG